MTVAKARVIFATHMHAARTRKLTAYERSQLSTARQVLRSTRKPAMNAPRKKLTLRQAQAEVRAMGLRLISNPEYNEYIVRVPGRSQADYFTNDLQDAVDSARTMAGWVKRQSNPKQRTLIYGNVQCIYAKKSQQHICDDDCKKHGHRYYHEFSSKPKMYGLPNGDLLITTR